MEKPEKAQKPISSYDTKALAEYFEKNFPNPTDSISWKLMTCGDYLIDHKNIFVRWGSVPIVFIVILPLYLLFEFYDGVRRKLRQKRRQR